MLPILKTKKTRPERNGWNNAFVAVVDPEAPYAVAVAAQEIVESRMKFGVIVFSAGAAIISGGLLALIDPWCSLTGLIFAGNAAYVLTSEWFRRELELIGHEVEVQVAAEYYDMDETMYRRREALLMSATYKQFVGYSVDKIEMLMRVRSSKAADIADSMDLRALADKLN